MRILVTGATGQLGSYLALELARDDAWQPILWSRQTEKSLAGLSVRSVDQTDPDLLLSALDEADPEVVIHAAAMSAAESVRQAPEAAWRINVEATGRLARWCRQHGRKLVFTSTDLVFDGTRGWYRESDTPAPVLAYGRTKAAAERLALEAPGAVVARLALLYGASCAGRPSFFDRAIERLKAGEPQTFFEDELRTPLHYATAARALLHLARTEASGVVHLAGRERVSRYELMQRAAQAQGLDPALVRANRRQDAALAEPRPADVSLDCRLLESLLPALERPSIEAALLASA